MKSIFSKDAGGRRGHLTMGRPAATKPEQTDCLPGGKGKWRHAMKGGVVFPLKSCKRPAVRPIGWFLVQQCSDECWFIGVMNTHKRAPKVTKVDSLDLILGWFLVNQLKTLRSSRISAWEKWLRLKQSETKFKSFLYYLYRRINWDFKFLLPLSSEIHHSNSNRTF